MPTEAIIVHRYHSAYNETDNIPNPDGTWHAHTDLIHKENPEMEQRDRHKMKKKKKKELV